MSVVRFSNVCDVPHCNRHSEEYTRWPTCRDCLQDVCPDHYTPESYDAGEGRPTAICLSCAAEAEAAVAV